MTDQGEAGSALARAVDEFNRGEYFACHETLERLWGQAASDERDFYQGILQIAVGCYHQQRGNDRGAQLCLERGMARLSAFGPAHQGIDVAALLAETQATLAAVRSASEGPRPARPAIRPAGSGDGPRYDAGAEGARRTG